MRILIILLAFAILENKVESFFTYPDSGGQSTFSSVKAVADNQNNLMENAIPGELCSRECKPNDAKLCHFEFTLKFYQVLSGYLT